MGSCLRCTGALQHPTCSEPCPLQSQLRGAVQSRGQRPRFCPQDHKPLWQQIPPRVLYSGWPERTRARLGFPSKHSRLFPFPIMTSMFSSPLPHSKENRSHHNSYMSFPCWVTQIPESDTVGLIPERSTCLSAVCTPRGRTDRALGRLCSLRPWAYHSLILGGCLEWQYPYQWLVISFSGRMCMTPAPSN